MDTKQSLQTWGSHFFFFLGGGRGGGGAWKCFPTHFNPNNSLLISLQISLPFMGTPALREVRNNRKFQTFNSKSGRGGLREVVTYERFQK